MRRAASCLLILVLLAACGSQGIGEEASSVLAPQVAGVRQALEDGDTVDAGQRLALVKLQLSQLQQDGKLDDEKSQQIAGLINEVALLLPQTPAQEPMQVPSELTGQEQGPASSGGQTGSQGAPGEAGEEGERGERGKGKAKGQDREDDDD